MGTIFDITVADISLTIVISPLEMLFISVQIC